MSQKAVIICVDDNQVVLTSLKSQLRREFGTTYEIETAESGEEAIEIFAEICDEGNEIPVVISDQIMPGMKGDEFLKKIYLKSKDTLSIMLTGQADAKAVGNAVNFANLYRYISKPWDEVDLNMTIREAIRSYYQDKKIAQQNIELEKLVEQLRRHNESLEETIAERTKEIIRQKNIIQAKNQDITDSILYAKKIQMAILPPHEHFAKHFADHFILYLPKDIVSGDFYWISERDNKIYVTAADCTGHGVPGAFMSMLGITLLNEIIDKALIVTAADILNELRNNIIKQLRQNKENQTRDGMDIAFCIIYPENKKINYAGAYNSLLYVKNDNIFEYKANKMPVALYCEITNIPFDDLYVDYNNGDKIYIFSDGYIDQFGGEKGRKLMMKNFINLIHQKSTLPMSAQKEELYNFHKTWKNDNWQLDDILIIGIQL